MDENARSPASASPALDPAPQVAGALRVARIDEAWCIGCTLCIAACPVDAIAGVPKGMHTVLAALCTGCELCIPPCPVDCIDMAPAGRAWSADDAQMALERQDARQQRLAAAQPDAEATAQLTLAHVGDDPARVWRQAAAAAAQQRARARRAARAKRIAP